MADELPRPFGYYILLESLGSGATGDVFLARPVRANQGVPTPVVIKRMHAHVAKQPGLVQRFRHEAQVALQARSVHLPKVWDAGQVDGTLYLVMDYVAGTSASKLINGLIATGELPAIGVAISVILDALEALAALHRAADSGTGASLGLVHRDVAPKNIMVGDDGRATLIDLGLAKSALQSWKTRTGAVMGTPGYMAPEQVLAHPADQRTDLYALGIVLWELTTLLPYIQRGSVSQILQASAAPVFRPPSAIRDDASASLDAICERALAVAPDERFQSADEMAQALASVAPRCSPTEVAALAKRALPKASAAREARLAALLAQRWSESKVRSQLGKTVAFVQADGVRALEADDLAQPPPVDPPPRDAAGPAKLHDDRAPVVVQAAAIVGLLAVMAGAFWAQMQFEDPQPARQTPSDVARAVVPTPAPSNATLVARPHATSVADPQPVVGPVATPPSTTAPLPAGEPARGSAETDRPTSPTLRRRKPRPPARTVARPSPRAPARKTVRVAAPATAKREDLADDALVPLRSPSHDALVAKRRAALVELMNMARSVQARAAGDEAALAEIVRLRAAIALDLESDDPRRLAATASRVHQGLDAIERDLQAK